MIGRTKNTRVCVQRRRGKKGRGRSQTTGGVTSAQVAFMFMLVFNIIWLTYR